MLLTHTLHLVKNRPEKQNIARRVVQLVQEQDPPGRFLVPEGKVYRQAEEGEAIEKVCQNLRERRAHKKKRLLKQDRQLGPNPPLIPRKTDVLFGQGNEAAAWPGNAKFGDFCDDLSQAYHRADRYVQCNCACTQSMWTMLLNTVFYVNLQTEQRRNDSLLIEYCGWFKDKTRQDASWFEKATSTGNWKGTRG